MMPATANQEWADPSSRMIRDVKLDKTPSSVKSDRTDSPNLERQGCPVGGGGGSTVFDTDQPAKRKIRRDRTGTFYFYKGGKWTGVVLLFD